MHQAEIRCLFHVRTGKADTRQKLSTWSKLWPLWPLWLKNSSRQYPSLSWLKRIFNKRLCKLGCTVISTQIAIKALTASIISSARRLIPGHYGDSTQFDGSFDAISTRSVCLENNELSKKQLKTEKVLVCVSSQLLTILSNVSCYLGTLFQGMTWTNVHLYHNNLFFLHIRFRLRAVAGSISCRVIPNILKR